MTGGLRGHTCCNRDVGSVTVGGGGGCPALGDIPCLVPGDRWGGAGVAGY